MCSFLSGIYWKGGRLLVGPEHSDSHTDLLESEGIADDKDPQFRSWVRVEFTPPDDWKDVQDLSKWNFRLDEPGAAPDWWAAKKDDCLEKLQGTVTRMLVSDERKILLGGCWILLSGAVIHKASNCRIVAMLGDAKVKVAQRFRVDSMWGSSQVNVMLGSSQVNVMLGSSQVNEMRESSQVNEMWESSQVNEMWGSSQVNEMRGSSQVNEMRGSSQVNEMRGSSQVNVMRGSSQVNVMLGSSQVNVMLGSSQVNEMRGSSQVNEMRGSSQAKPHPDYGSKTKIVRDERTVPA